MINNIHRTLYSNEQGKFGIDHTNPTHLLTIGNPDTTDTPVIITSKADAQIHLVSPDTWTGIKFNDAATGEDFLWHHGENGGVFSMGGGGAFGTNRKLHVHGGVTIGEGFQGETTIGASNSLFVQNRVGIGTVNPIGSLHIKQSSDLAKAGGLILQRNSDVNMWKFAQGGTNDNMLSLVFSDDAFTTDGEVIFNILGSSGRVGVGTTSPNYKFEVVVPNDDGFSIVSASDTNNGWRLKPSGNDFRIGQNGIADRFTIKDGGKVGIATTNPEVANGGLHIFGTGSRAGLRIGGGNDSATESRIYIDSNGDSSYLDSYGNGAHQKFQIETSELYLNVLGGRVGIGTSSPSSALDIHDPSSNATTLTLGRSGEVPTIKAGGTNTDLRFEAVGSGGWMEFRTNNEMRMRINADGKVGIGTDTPTDELQIKGSSAPYINVEASDASDAGVSFARQGVKKWYVLNDPDYSDNFAIRGDGGTPDQFLTITQTGKVGIGTANPQSSFTVAHQESRFGVEYVSGQTKPGWNDTDPNRLVFNDHGNFWIGAGNGTWFTGTANTKTMASGLATDATYAHDLLITTYTSDSTHDRGITFAASDTSDGSASSTNTDSGWRLGKWHSGVSSATSKFAIDGGLIVKGGYTDTYDYYVDDYSIYYTAQGADGAAWGGDSGWLTPSIMAATAIQIQSGNNNVSNSNNPALQFHQYGYGGVQMRYHGPGDTLWIEDTSTDGSRMNRVIFASDNRSNDTATAMTLSVTHQSADNYGSGIDLVSGDAAGSSRHFSPFIRFYDTSNSTSDMANAAVGDLNWSLGVDDTAVSSFRLQYVSGEGGTKANNIRTGSSRLWIDGPTGKVGIGTDTPNYQLEVGTAAAMSGNWSKSLKLTASHPVICLAGANGTKHAFIGYDTASSTEGLSLNVSGTTDDRNSSTLGIKINNRGYVGVGFNNPSYRLDVNDDSGTYKIPGLRLLGPSPTMKFEDTESDDFYLHVNADNFYIMTDKDDDNTHDSPYPLRLDNSTSKGYVYSHEIVHAGNAYDYLPRMISTNYFNHIPLPYNCTANATISRRTRIMRTTIDTNDWSSKGTIMIQLFERYYYGDRMKRYIIDFNPYTTPGGSETPNARAILVEEIGTGLGSYYDVYCETATHATDSNGGNIRYCDIWVRCKNYAQVSVVITTNSNLSESTTPAANRSYIWEESPTLEDISNFTTESQTVDQRAVHVNKTMSGSLIAKSEVENRPLFPGGFVSTEAGGSADIWGPDRTHNPSNSSTSYRWGIKWDDPNNQIIFMGGGSNRLLIDLDGGSGGLTWEGHKIWNAGNDGSGSGLDADTLDGVHASNFIRKSGLGSSSYYSADAWIEMKDTTAGIYWSGGSGSGWHLYPKSTNDLYVRSGTTNTGLLFTGNGTTPWGYVYANSSKEIGFLNAGRSWRILCKMGTNGTSHYNPNMWFKGEQGSAWSGDPGIDEAKIEYHSDIMYFAAGSNSNTTNSFIFRRGGTNISYINSSGKYMGDTDKLDGLHASSFVRSDTNDTKTGRLDFGASMPTLLNDTTHTQIYQYATNPYTVKNSGNVNTWQQEIHYRNNVNTWRIGTYDTDNSGGAGKSIYRIAGKNRSGGAEINYIVCGPKGDGWTDRTVLYNPYVDTDGDWDGSGTQYKIWHAGNDGPGSDLDADKLDGLHASSFLRSGSSTQNIYGGQIIASDWLRNNTSGEGLYNSVNDAHFYSAGANYWHINGDSGGHTSGGLIFYDRHNSAQGGSTGRKGYVYWDSSGFGLLSNDGSWGVRCTNSYTDLYGTIRQDGTNTVWHGGNDGSGSGLDADKVDGVHGSSFLRSDANDTFTGKLSVGSTTSRQAGVYGVYDSYKTGHIWSMGTGYVINSSGTNFGNLYGFGYKHTNNSTGGTMGGGHMAVWCQNGTPYVSLGTHIWCKNNITAYSDARVKDDITTITNAVDKVKSIRGVTYKRTDFDDSVDDGVEKNKRQMGVIAQEILDVIPEVVTGGPTEQDPEGHYSVAYGNMVALLIEAVKEQQTQLDKQQQQIEQLKQQIEK